MIMRTIATTIDSGDFDRLDEMTGGFGRVVTDAHYQLGVEGVGRGGIALGIAPYLTTLTLAAVLLAVWAGICSI